MLQNMHEKSQGFVTWFIVLLVIGAFAFFGLTDYFSFGSNASVAAKVNGEKISWRTVDAMYQRLAHQYGNQMDPALLRDQIRRGLVQREALMAKAKTLGFRVGDEQIANAMLQIPAFQENGQFSKERYLKVLSEASYSDTVFRRELANDILLGQLEQGINLSSFTAPSELTATVALLDQKRDIGYLTIPIKQIEKGIQISAEDIQTYYDSHKDNFVKPEQVSLEYVELSLEDLAKEQKVSKEDMLAYYTQHQDAYTAPERVRVRHILIDSQSKDKVEAILQEAKKSGADFAKLAKTHSRDVGSAEKGGDLGWFSRGQMVPEFEKAAFALKKPGDISSAESKFGVHIIQLVEHKKAEIRSFSEMKPMVEAQLKHDKAQAVFAEKGEKLAKLAFEQPTSLASVVEQMGLRLQTTELFDKEGGKDIANQPEVVKAAFSEAVIKGNNSEALKLAEGITAVVRVKTHVPSEQQALAMVEKQVRAELATERAKVKIKEVGEALVKRIQAGENPVELAKTEKTEWKTKSDMVRMQAQENADRNIVMAAFQIPSAEAMPNKPGVRGFALPEGDYMIIAVSKVKPGDLAKLDTGTQNNYRKSLTDVSSQLEFALYANHVLRESKIELTKDPMPTQN